MNKRGVEKLVAYLIIAILMVIVAFIVFYAFFGGLHIQEGTCKMKSALLSIAPTGVKPAVGEFTSCKAVNERIDGNDWSRCTDEIKKQFEDCRKSGSTGTAASEGSAGPSALIGAASADMITGAAVSATDRDACELDAQRECAAYQMAKLAERCWSMYSGSNHFEGQKASENSCGDFQCFDIEVFDTGKKVDFVDRAKKYITAGHGLAANFYVYGNCASKNNVELCYVDDTDFNKQPNQDGVCLKC